jgi:tripartite-type tricarboxylate transporter receptor subunit TctC
MKVLLSCLLLFAAGGIWAQPAAADYPDNPIYIPVTAPAGGGADIGARAAGAKLSKLPSVSVIVENRGGARGTIAPDPRQRLAKLGIDAAPGAAQEFAKFMNGDYRCWGLLSKKANPTFG